MRRMFCLALLGAIASSCTARAEELIHPLYPLRVGSVWTYKMSGANELIQVKVTKKERVYDEECYRLETISGGTLTAAEHVVVRNDGVYRTALNGNRFDTPVKMLDAMKAAKWTANTKIDSAQVTGDFVMKEEEVSVPAGAFKGATLVESKNAKAKGQAMAIKFWYAKDVGIVKFELNSGDQKAILELVKYEPGPSPAPNVECRICDTPLYYCPQRCVFSRRILCLRR